MPVYEQGYRRYTGTTSSGSRALAIAWENIRPLLRWWVWALLFVLGAWPYLFYFVIIFLKAYGLGGIGSHTRADITGEIAFEHRGSPDNILAMLQSDSMGMFWHILDSASYASLILPAVVCAGLLASDRRTGALQIYFARPVTRLDYLLGKVIAGAFFVAITTALPCLVLWIEDVSMGAAASFTWRTWVTPLSIIGASAVYALWTISVVLALSAVMKRPGFVAIVSIFLVLLLEAIGGILKESFHERAWFTMRPTYAIGTVTAPLFGLGLPGWINVTVAYLIALGLPAALLTFVWWRVRAVEVVT
jgi:ABC-type transport system involved in multi-copper enzyme maturation permease subunit